MVCTTFASHGVVAGLLSSVTGLERQDLDDCQKPRNRRFGALVLVQGVGAEPIMAAAGVVVHERRVEVVLSEKPAKSDAEEKRHTRRIVTATSSRISSKTGSNTMRLPPWTWHDSCYGENLI
jgi:hypothetical protein